MPLTDLMWLALASYGLPTLEECQLNWRDVLFYPVGTACYMRAAADGVLGAGNLVGSLALGALPMATPVVLLAIKGKPNFRQDR